MLITVRSEEAPSRAMQMHMQMQENDTDHPHGRINDCHVRLLLEQEFM
jgi:hypothetical protein